MKQDVTLVSTAQLYAQYQTRIGALTSLKCSITQLCGVTFDEITVKPILFPQYTHANNLYWMLATIRLCVFYVSTLAAEKTGQFICGSWNTSSTLDAYRGGSLFQYSKRLEHSPASTPKAYYLLPTIPISVGQA